MENEQRSDENLRLAVHRALYSGVTHFLGSVRGWGASGTQEVCEGRREGKAERPTFEKVGGKNQRY